MNLKQLLILLVLLAVIGGAGLVLHHNQQSSWSGGSDMGKKLLGDFSVNDVARISIRQDTNELNLVRKDDLWRVRERDDYPAAFSQIRDFLFKAHDLKIVQSEPVGSSQLGRFALAGQGSNAPVTVELEGADGRPIKTLVLGKKHLKTGGSPSPMGEGDAGWPDGRYVKAGADSPNVVLIADPLDAIEPRPDQWLNKDFFRVEKPGAVSVTFPAATNSWKLARETESGDWKLADAKPGEQLDLTKIAGVTNPFGSPEFTDVLPDDKILASGTNAPVFVAIETFDHFHYQIKIGQKANDDYFLAVAVSADLPKERIAGKDEKPEDKAKLDREFADRRKKLEDKLKLEQDLGKWTYLMPGWNVDPVLKERAQLLVGKSAEPKTGADLTNAVSGQLPAEK